LGTAAISNRVSLSVARHSCGAAGCSDKRPTACTGSHCDQWLAQLFCSATRALEGRLERQRLGAKGLVHTPTTATLTAVRGEHTFFNRVFPSQELIAAEDTVKWISRGGSKHNFPCYRLLTIGTYTAALLLGVW